MKKYLNRSRQLVKAATGELPEAADVGKIIQTVIDAKPSDDNAEQGKLVQLLRGLAFSDDPKSTAFMKKLTSLINDANFGDLAKKEG